MKEAVAHLKYSEFDKFIENGEVVVDFWAPWCGPCQMMGPEFEKASREFKGKIKFAKVNVDEEQELAQRFQIRGIPTMILFKDKEQTKRVSGAMDSEDIVRFVKEK